MINLPRALSVLLGASAAAAVAFASFSARSQTAPSSSAPATSAASAAPAAPASSATSTASAAATASGTAAAAAAAVIRGAAIPYDPSPAPKDDAAWAGATEIALNTGTLRCKLLLLREWLRIECPDRIGGALIVGEKEGVKISAWGDPMPRQQDATGAFLSAQPFTRIVTPVRRGDAKVFQLAATAEERYWVGPTTAELLSVSWREGDEDPWLVSSAGDR